MGVLLGSYRRPSSHQIIDVWVVAHHTQRRGSVLRTMSCRTYFTVLRVPPDLQYLLARFLATGLPWNATVCHDILMQANGVEEVDRILRKNPSGTAWGGGYRGKVASTLIKCLV